MRWRAAAGLLLWLALLAGLIWWISSRQPQYEGHQDNPQHAATSTAVKGQTNGESFWVRTTSEPVAFFTFALFCATAVLGIVAVAQIYFLKRADDNTRLAANAAMKSATVAENSLKAANRPLITIAPLLLIGASKATGAPHIHFGCRNSGHGVAIVHKIAVFISTVEPSKNTLRLDAKTEFISRDIATAIEVGDSQDIGRVECSLLTNESITSIRSGTLTLLVTIQIISQDLLSNPYDQLFPFEFDATRGEFVRNSSFVENGKKTNSNG